MAEWLNASVLASSAVGSLIAGVLLISAKPIWWKWVNTEAVRTGIKSWLPFMLAFILFVGGIFGIASYMYYVERTNIPPSHPTLTEKQAAAARAECKMKAIEATATLDMYQRDIAEARYYGACLASKGFEWNEP